MACGGARCGGEQSASIYRHGEAVEGPDRARRAHMAINGGSEKYLTVDSAGEASAGIRGRGVIAVLRTRPVEQGRASCGSDGWRRGRTVACGDDVSPRRQLGQRINGGRA
jgi:hypothetical protein